MTTAQSEDTGEEDSFSEVSINTRSTIGLLWVRMGHSRGG